jgi:hypothetical protein
VAYNLYKDGRVVVDIWEGGKRLIRRSLTKQERADLGIADHLTHEQKRAMVKRLNLETRRDKQRVLTARRLKEAADLDSQYTPAPIVEDWWQNIGNLAGFRMPHWNAVKRLIQALDAPPMAWYQKVEFIYAWAIQAAYSPAYTKELIRVLNSYGRHYCRTIREPWEPVPPPRGAWARRVRRAFYRKTGGSGLASAKLPIKAIRAARAELTPSNYAWLFISAAFGLRPEEVNVDYFSPKRKELLVYQPKKERLGFPNPKCWKRIPIKLVVQREALTLVAELRGRPSRRVMRKVFGRRVTLYGGRKWFAWYMRRVMKYDPVLVSRWMGHESYDTTRKFYDIDEDVA